jgi:hypothetical protein
MMTCSSLKYSDHSGAIGVSPQLSQMGGWAEPRRDATVVMKASLSSI